jgi:hypothetical protein
VNTYTDRDQYLSDTGSLISGGFIVCWQSYLQDGVGEGVYGQLFDENGTKRGKEFQINTYSLSDQDFVTVCGLSNGNLVAGWQSNRHDEVRFGIYAKYYLGSPISHSLSAFSLLSPKFDVISEVTTVTFQWEKANTIHVNFPWEVEYKLLLDSNEEFSDPQIYSDIYDTTLTVKELTPGKTYFWKVLVKNIDGDSLWSSKTFGFYVNPAAAVEENITGKTFNFKLYPNYPNPFNPTTVIGYQLPAVSDVELSIYNVLGEKVVVLVSESQNAGYHQVEWDASQFSSGFYFLFLDTGKYEAEQKLLLVK